MASKFCMHIYISSIYIAPFHKDPRIYSCR